MNGQDDQAQSGWQATFFTIWSAQAVSLLGSQMVSFALIWWLTKTSGSAMVLATATLAAMLPQILFGPLAGALVDRWNRRLVMMAADGLVALATLFLAGLFWLGQAQVWHIYLLMAVRSVAGIFHWAAMQASTSLMVPRVHLTRIQGLNQILNGAMNIGSAPLGALLMSVLPMQAILGIDVLTALVAITPLGFVRIPQPEQPKEEAHLTVKPTLWQDLRQGLRYVWSWPGLMGILVLAMMINLLLSPASSLQPLLVAEHFHGQAVQLAWMESAWGVGVVVGGLVLSAWGGFRRRIVTSLLGLVLLGAAVLSVGLLPPSGLLLAIAATFVIGFMNPIVNGPLFAVLQDVVAPEMQGRVFTLVNSLASCVSPLGLLAAGPIADNLGVPVWFLISGLLTGLLGLGAFLVPAIMNIEQQRQAAAPLQPLAESAAD